jgi:membrane protein implicated in regulation of membrane protease activity
MTDWMIWFAVACVLIILEMATGTFYLLMIAIGAIAGGIVALSGADGAWQCILAAVIAAAATFALRRSRFGQPESLDASRDPGVNLDIGQTLEVAEWRSASGTISTARVMYRGALWDVELAGGGVAVAGQFRIQEVQGNRLIVINNNTADS